MIYDSMEALIGGTPLLRLNNIKAELGLCADLVAKLEYLNPAGSAKDRIALNMLNRAEEEGLLKPGGVIIEPTSGNTGIGLAAVGAARGYRVIIVMSDNMSVERIKTMKGYGAEVVLTPGSQGMQGCISKANELAAQLPGSFIPGQFDNPANPLAHYKTTGPEIWRDTEGRLDFLVAGVGTGGTITGTGRYLKEMNPSIQVVAVEPDTSPLLSKGYAGSHGLQGIGANFVPSVLDTGIYDSIMTVSLDEAYRFGRMMGRREGILVGISSGAALSAAADIASREENAGKTVVVMLTDTGDRYLSTAMFGE